jgi:hypothetical protein
MPLVILLVDNWYQYNVNRLLSGCADSLPRPIEPLEMTAPQRHNGIHPSNATRQ